MYVFFDSEGIRFFPAFFSSSSSSLCYYCIERQQLSVQRRVLPCISCELPGACGVQSSTWGLACSPSASLFCKWRWTGPAGVTRRCRGSELLLGSAAQPGRIPSPLIPPLHSDRPPFRCQLAPLSEHAEPWFQRSGTLFHVSLRQDLESPGENAPEGWRKVGRPWRNPLKHYLISAWPRLIKKNKLLPAVRGVSGFRVEKKRRHRKVSLPLNWIISIRLGSKLSFSRWPDNYCIPGSCTLHIFGDEIACAGRADTAADCARGRAALQTGALPWKNNTCPPPTGAPGTPAQMINLIQRRAAELRLNLVMPLWFVATKKVQFLFFLFLLLLLLLSRASCRILRWWWKMCFFHLHEASNHLKHCCHWSVVLRPRIDVLENISK